MSRATALAGLESALASADALVPQFEAALDDARVSGDPALVDRHQSRWQALYAIREAIGRCIQRTQQVAGP